MSLPTTTNGNDTTTTTATANAATTKKDAPLRGMVRQKTAPPRGMPRSNSAKRLFLLGLASRGAAAFTSLPTPAHHAVGKGAKNAEWGPGSLHKVKSCPNLAKTSTSLDVFSADHIGMLGQSFSGGLSLHSDNNPVHKVLDGFGSMLTADSAPDVEDEGMRLATHALLDFSSHWAQATVAIRMADVVGRLLVIGQSFLPGHSMSPDEYVFQLGFLAASVNSLHKVIQPKVKALKASRFLTPQDRAAFRKVFQPAGLKWDEFRELSTEAMEWVTLEPGQKVKDDAIYWLYEGSIEVESVAAPTRKMTGDKSVSGQSRLVGEEHIAKMLGLADPASPTTTATVTGEGEATFLRLSSTKLQHLIKHNVDLSTSMNRLVFQSMQSRLSEGRLEAALL